HRLLQEVMPAARMCYRGTAGGWRPDPRVAHTDGMTPLSTRPSAPSAVAAPGARPSRLARVRDGLRLGRADALMLLTMLIWGTNLISVSLAAIILATAPLLTACMAALWAREPLRLRAVLSLAVSFTGVVVVIAGGHSTLGASWRGGLFILGAAITLGLGAILA